MLLPNNQFIAEQPDSLLQNNEIGISLPNNQRQHPTSHAPTDVLPLCIVLVTVSSATPVREGVWGWGLGGLSVAKTLSTNRKH